MSYASVQVGADKIANIYVGADRVWPQAAAATPGGGEAPGMVNRGALLYDDANIIGSGTATRAQGFEFTANTSVSVTALAFYAPSVQAGTMTLRLWRVSDAALLGSVEIVSPVAAEWNEAELEVPVELTAGVNYVLGSGGLGRTWYSTLDGLVDAMSSDFTYVTGRFQSFVGSQAFPSSLSAGNSFGHHDMRYSPAA